jgi:delta24-sterol reductase
VVDENDNDSVEGIMFTKDKGVIMTGTFCDNYEPGKLNRMGLWFKPWFYKVRIQKIIYLLTAICSK